jgi:hypothetical protein
MSVDGTAGRPSKAALDGPLAKRKRSAADGEMYMVQVRFANQQSTGTILANRGSLQTKRGPYSASSYLNRNHMPSVWHFAFLTNIDLEALYCTSQHAKLVYRSRAVTPHANDPLLRRT